jgi:hypothetical protein
MTKEIKAKPQLGWLEAIAERSKYTRKDIQNFVKKYKIPQTP